MQDRFARRGRQRHLVAPDARVLSRAALDGLEKPPGQARTHGCRHVASALRTWLSPLPRAPPPRQWSGRLQRTSRFRPRSIPMTSLPRSLRSNRSGRLMAILTLRRTRLCHHGQQCTRSLESGLPSRSPALLRVLAMPCVRSSMALPYVVSPSFESSVVRPRAHCESVESSPRVDRRLPARPRDGHARRPSSAARSAGPAAHSPRSSGSRTEARTPPSRASA